MSATTITANNAAQRLRRARSFSRPIDVEAMNIRFGVELETKVPRTSGIAVGGYHVGYPVRSARATNGQELPAPTFNGATWRADRDGSITCEPGETACEFVSPILHGEAGVENLCQFVEWMIAVGAKADTSCGCHITVGVESVIGSSDAGKVSDFVRKLAHIAQWHAMSLYGQTGIHFSKNGSASMRQSLIWSASKRRKIWSLTSRANNLAASSSAGNDASVSKSFCSIRWMSGLKRSRSPSAARSACSRLTSRCCPHTVTAPTINLAMR